MDPTIQLAQSDATGVERGLYADVRETFRAQIVNSIWRTCAAHYPELTRYVWGQVKPAFQTRDFAAFTVAYRDRVLSSIEDDLPRYDPATLDIEPSAFTELRGQAATFDVVAPRLAVLFFLMDRRLNDGPVGTDAGGAATAAPFPDWLDRDRGRPPSMLSQDEARETMPDSLTGDIGEMIPSIYRCLAQWPGYLDRATQDLAPALDSEAFAAARAEAADLVETYLDRLPYTPRVDPEGLAGVGADEEAIADLQRLFGTFRAGGEDLLPLLHVHAATVGAAGEREALSFP